MAGAGAAELAAQGAALEEEPPPGGGEEEWRDWAGLPEHVLVQIPVALVARTEAAWAAQLKNTWLDEEYIQEKMAQRQTDGNCPFFVFAMVQGVAEGAAQGRGPAAHPGGVGRGHAGAGGAGEVGAGGGVPQGD